MIQCNLSKGDDPITQIKECLDIIKKIENANKKEEEIILDFSGINWILPCSALLLSSKIVGLIKNRSKIKYIEPEKESVKKYLRDIGFPLGSNKEGDTYSPIKHFDNNQDVNVEVNNLLKQTEDKIPSTFGSSIQYILGELSDNIIEHSKFKNASLMAQYYPQKDYIDIGILDDGLSIPVVFEKNKIKFPRDSKAILMAFEGTTTKQEEPSRGFGLRSTKEIVKKALKGEMHIISRKGVIIINKDTEEKEHDLEENELNGTLLYMRLNTPRKHLNIYPYLE